MATRVTPSELAGRLTGLLAVAAEGGRVVISCRDHYFPDKQNLPTAWQRALNNAMGQSVGTLRMMVQLLDDRQVRNW